MPAALCFDGFAWAFLLGEPYADRNGAIRVPEEKLAGVNRRRGVSAGAYFPSTEEWLKLALSAERRRE
jgi:hypothetical protein